VADRAGLDVAAVRAEFPALAGGQAFFDAPGGSQTPSPVIAAMVDALANPLSNRGELTEGERNSEGIVREARAALGDFLGADPGAVVFGRSATALTYDVSRALAATWEPGDEVVVTRLDHDANIRPWQQAAARAGVTLRWADFDPGSGELTVDHVTEVLSERTRLVAVTAASNLIGTTPPVAEIAERAHAAGALVHVDAVHYAAHRRVDLAALGADLLVCSPYKFFGPHLGVLAARPEVLEPLRPDKLAPSTDRLPERFELGTLPYELLAGARAAVDFVASLDPSDGSPGRPARLDGAFALMHGHEERLRAAIEQGLAELPGVRLYSRAARRTPTLLFTLDGRDSAEAYEFLARRRVSAPASSFYALEASRRLGLGDTGGLRVGLAPYNIDDDVDRLLGGLREFLGG
jgi:cysteine desulfurase family protein (TIGR01976 family)